MRFFLLLNLFLLSLYAETDDLNSSTKQKQERVLPQNDVIVVKDTSGLSDDEVRMKAKKSDKQKKARVNINEVVKTIDKEGNIDLSRLQERWEDLSPTPVKYDWIKTKSGEWFKGEIKALYDDALEFDSAEVGDYTFDFDDVVEIKSFHIISVNIENLASFPGIIRLKNKKITIIQGDHSYEFNRKDIVSFAPDGELERNLWSGRVIVSLDARSGNTNQYDFTTKINLQRRTASSRLTLDYLGRMASKDDVETTNDHRINEKYDRYITRHFFWTPVFSEIYTDKYKNIDKQLTLGLGVGYTIIDTKQATWSFSGGPAGLYTRYITVEKSEDTSYFSPALELSTKYELELKELFGLTKKLDVIYDYKLTYTDDVSGKYKHHMILTFENEITSWLDFDVTGVWDYILKPEREEDGSLPDQSDFQLLVGLGVEF